MAETLELKIKSSADQAAKSIENLKNKLKSLGGALSSINGSGLHNFSAGLRELSTSIRRLSSIDTRTFSKVAQNVQRLGNIDSSKLIKSAAALNGMSKELSAFSGLAQQSQNITTLTQSISKLGSKSATNAAANIKELGKALKEVMVTLNNTPRVNQSIIHMTNALANLASQGSKVGSASRSLTASFSNVTKSAERTKSGFGRLSVAIGKFYATYWLLIRATSKLRDAVDLSSQLTEVQNVVDTTFGNMTYKVDEFAKRSIQDLGMSELSVKQISSRFQAMGTAVGITSEQVSSGTSIINKKFLETKNTLYQTSDSMADISLNLTRLAADMASFYDVDQADVAKSLQSVFTGTTAPLRRYGLDLTQATLKEWALKNGIDANIKSMSQAEKVLLRYQYVMANTTAAQGDFAKTANTWANAVRVLKQEFQAWGAVVGGIVINVFKPLVIAMNRVMVKVINFTKTIADALGAIFGWTIETSASGVADSTDEVADSMADVGTNASNANRNATKLKKTLLSIDEIHALDDNSSSSSNSGGSGGSGAGGSGTDAAATSNLTRTNGLIEKYKSSISSLGELGSHIGRAITNSLNSINWDRIYQSAKNFGKGLADFLNGLISPSLFGALGKTIAGAIRTAIIGAFSFTSNFNWKNLGKSFAEFINGALREMSRISKVTGLSGWQELAKTLNNIVHGIRDTLIETIKNVNWKSVFKGIGEFIGELDLDTFAIIIGGFLWKHGGKEITKALLTNAWTKFAKEKQLSSLKLGAYVAEAVITIAAVSYVINHMKGWIESVREWLKTHGITSGPQLGIDGKMHYYTKSFDWIIKEINWKIEGFKDGVANFFTNLAKETKKAFKRIFDFSLAEELFNEMITSFETAFDGKRADFLDIGAYVLEGILDGLTSAIAFISAPFVNIFQWIWNGICKVFGIHSPAKEMKPLGKYILQGIVEGFKNSFDEMTKAIKTFFKDYVKPWFTKEKWKSNIGSIEEALKNKWSDAVDWWSEKTPLKDISISISNFVEKLKEKWKSVKDWWSEKTPLKDISISISDFVERLKEKWKNIKDWWSEKTPLNEIDVKSNDFISEIKDKWNKLKSWWKKLKLTVEAKIKVPHIKVNWSDYGKFKIPSFEVKYYRAGGFPKGEDGMFLANHNEMIGKFSNGKNVVANNQQITEGIRRAVVDGMMEVMMNTNGQGSNNAPIIENTFKVDSETLYRITQRGKAKHNQRYNVVTEF